MIASLGGILLGVLLGLRHALEPDHLTAISTLVAGAPGARRGAWVGAVWGLVHTISLVVVGTILLATGSVLPVRAAAAFELAVAAMLVLLGLRSLVVAWRDGRRGPVDRHRHAGGEHAHAAPDAHLHIAGRPLAWRPLVVGLVHGLAGSGAITALVFAQLPTLATRVAYIALFGVGSIAGMAIASGLTGASLHRVTRGSAGRRTLACVTGVLSVGVGIIWAIPELRVI